MAAVCANTKTGMIKLQVPPRKLGAVLSAIGAALDGHPWAPYEHVNVSSRGCRGGRRRRERKVSSGPQRKTVEPKKAVPATNPPGKTGAGGVPISCDTSSSSLPKMVRKGGSSQKPPLTPHIVGTPSVTRVASVSNLGSVGGLTDLLNREVAIPGAERRSVEESYSNTSRADSSSAGRCNSEDQADVEYTDVTHQSAFGSRYSEIMRLRALVVDLNTVEVMASTENLPTSWMLKHTTEKFRPRMTGIWNSETEAEYKRARQFWRPSIPKTTPTKSATKYANIAHLSVCSSRCECLATHNEEYMALLTRHRRAFTFDEKKKRSDSSSPERRREAADPKPNRRNKKR